MNNRHFTPQANTQTQQYSSLRPDEIFPVEIEDRAVDDYQDIIRQLEAVIHDLEITMLALEESQERRYTTLKEIRDAVHNKKQVVMLKIRSFGGI